MTDTIKEITDFSPHHHFHPFDPEDPEAFSTCIEEKKYLLKSYQQRRYFGRHIPFCWRNNEPFLTLGPQWPLFLVTWCGLLGIGVFVIIHIPGNRSPLLRVSAVIVTIWQSMIYLLTALKNPGIVTAKDANDLTLLNSNCQANCCKICKVCKVVTTKDTRHCSNCKVCIKGFDHHCPWTGKCIGAGNACQFYTFLFSTAFYITFCMVVAGLYLK